MAQYTPGIVLRLSGVVLEVEGVSTLKYSATLVLSKLSLSFEATNGEKLDILLKNVDNIKFHQPIFGASYISGLWVGEGTFSLTFKEGGGATCFEKLSELAGNAIGDSMLPTGQALTDSKCKKMQ